MPDRSGAHGDEAEPEPELAQIPQQAVDPRPQLEDVEVAGHRWTRWRTRSIVRGSPHSVSIMWA